MQEQSALIRRRKQYDVAPFPLAFHPLSIVFSVEE
jgi:hypothetical protein